MVLTERPLNISKHIFEKIPSPSFIYNDFTFRLVRREPNSDIFNYDIHENGNPDTRLRFVFFGVDATCEYGAASSLDLFQFCWTYAERLIQ